MLRIGGTACLPRIKLLLPDPRYQDTLMSLEADLITQWVPARIRALSAYHVPPPADYIKLDAMENPYSWEAGEREDWLAALRGVAINRYPDAAARETRAMLRETMRVPGDMALTLGNGSDELIQMLMLLMGPGRCVLAPEPSFVMYRMLAEITGLDYVGLPLNPADFSLDRAAALAAVEKHQPALIFLAYPNNPTGNLFQTETVEAIIRAAPGLVVVDEAYAAFTDSSFMARLGKFPNLLVMRTVSKIGLAGLRLGLLAGPPAWLEQVEKIRLPYNINVLTQASAVFALRHDSRLRAQTRQIREDREQLQQALASLNLVYWPSEANFILFRLAKAGEVFERLKQHGILIKCLHGSHPLLTDCLRVTVGKPEENRAFLRALESSL